MPNYKTNQNVNDYSYDKKTGHSQNDSQDKKRQRPRNDTSPRYQNYSPAKTKRKVVEERKYESVDGVDYERQVPIPILLGYPGIFRRD